MVATSEREAVVELAREAVARSAPDELPLVEATAQAYFAASRRAREARTPDDMLGFRLGEAAAIVTPVALTVAGQALRFVIEQAGSVFEEEVGGKLRSLVRRLFARLRRTPAGERAVSQLAPLTSKQLGAVRDLAYSRAQELGIEERQAALMADAIVGGLALRASPS